MFVVGAPMIHAVMQDIGRYGLAVRIDDPVFEHSRPLIQPELCYPVMACG